MHFHHFLECQKVSIFQVESHSALFWHILVLSLLKDFISDVAEGGASQSAQLVETSKKTWPRQKKNDNVNFLWPGGVFERFEENFGGQIKSGDQSGEKYSLMTMTNKTPCMHRRSSYYQMDPI